MSKQPNAPGTASSRFAGPVGWVRDLPIWTKLGLIMIVPTLATIVVGTSGLLDQVQQASNAERARALAEISGDAGNLVHRLQDERAAAVRVLISAAPAADQAKAAYREAQEKTDAANNVYRVSRSTLADVPANLRELLDQIQTQLGELPVMRGQVEARNKIQMSIAERRYRVLIADLLTIRDISAQLTGDSVLTDRLRAAAAVATAKEYLSQERAVVAEALAYREMPQAVRRDYIATRNGQELALTNFAGVATAEQREILDRTVTGPELRETLLFEGKLDSLPADTDPNLVVDADDWDQRMMGRANLMNSVEVTLNGQAQQAAAELSNQVQRRVLLETGMLLGTLLLGVLFAWMVARSMARSLRDLRQGALAVAQYGLPQAVARLRDPALASHLSPAGVALQIAEPLPVRSRDEFGQVTEAFNAVHLEAVRTAAEQAALRSSVATMFVNLARRSQILVDRLIGHLDRLERGEQDPDRLSELFQLDHLATRMRRNDENLLVLAGADSTRVQREPAALMDVMRAAQSEVEHYTRIEFAVIDPDIEIAAHAVNDLVHLVAELFDNATAFSPPDTAITVEARRVGDRAVLQVEDRGIGMSPDQYAELNERLATPPMVDVAVSRMMGLVVVARLAARHGVKVELRSAQERGTVADVLLPSGVLVPRALAGRSKAPAGFPASRPSVPPARPVFAPPLALESGPSAGSTWSRTDDSYAGNRGAAGAMPFNPSPAGASAANGGGFVPGGTGFGPTTPPGTPGGLGAALAGEFGAPPPGPPTANGIGGNGTASRPLPAWYDLTGAGGEPGPAPASASPVDPLPQRRPGGQWGDPDPDLPDVGAPGQRTPPPADTWPPAAGGAPTAPPAGPLGSPPVAAQPPVWPPVAAEPDYGGADPVPSLPETLSASLDMTSELPRIREADAATGYSSGYPEPGYADSRYSGSGYADSRYADSRYAEPVTPPPAAAPTSFANDLTMELPIFSELESAWFHTDASPAPSSAMAGATRSESLDMGGGGAAARAGSTRAAGTAGAEDAGSGDHQVSWRSIADEGWLAAQAATDPTIGGQTDSGLPRRVPMAQLVPGGVETASAGSDRRTPDAVRGLLSAYTRGVQRGRNAQGRSTESEPDSSASLRDSSQTSGKEQEA